MSIAISDEHRALADAASNRGRQPDFRLSPAAQRLYDALLERGVPARAGQADEGYVVAIAVDDLAGSRIDVEVSEFPGGDPRGAIQRQMDVRDGRLRCLGWRVVRVPGWRAYLEPAVLAAELLQMAMGQASPR